MMLTEEDKQKLRDCELAVKNRTHQQQSAYLVPQASLVRMPLPQSTPKRRQIDTLNAFPQKQGMYETIKAHPTQYAGVQFRSRLEARWACFLDLIGWDWQYEPLDILGWSPDFRVEFPCGHSDCPNTHVLLVEVKPYFSIKDFEGHCCMDFPFGGHEKKEGGCGHIPADASAAFGNNPQITYWEMAHGAGGGIESIASRIGGHIDIDARWKRAGNTVQWKP
jgi:hypothetical protein